MKFYRCGVRFLQDEDFIFAYIVNRRKVAHKRSNKRREVNDGYDEYYIKRRYIRCFKSKIIILLILENRILRRIKRKWINLKKTSNRKLIFDFGEFRKFCTSFFFYKRRDSVSVIPWFSIRTSQHNVYTIRFENFSINPLTIKPQKKWT